MSGVPEPAVRVHRPLSAAWLAELADSFRYAGFRRFWTASVTVQTSFRMGDVVLAWQILEATDSALYVGWLAFTSGLPLLVVSPFAGVLADRVKRQHMLLGAMLVGAATLGILAALTASGRLLPWHVLAAAFVKGTAFSLYAPARLALMPTLIPRAALPKASAVEYASARLAGFFGPIVAGVVLGLLGMVPALGAQAALFLVAGVLFARLGPGQEDGIEVAVGPGPPGNLVQGLAEANRYLRLQNRPLLALLGLNLVMVSFGMSYAKLIPVYVRDVLGAGPETVGLLLGATSLAGALAGFSLGARREVPQKGRLAWVTVGLFGVVLVGFSAAGSLGPALLLGVVLGLLSGTYLTLTHVLFHSRSPDRLRGRMMSYISMVWGIAPFAHLGGGAVAEVWGVSAALAVAGGVCAVAATAFGMGRSRLREL